MNVLVLPQSKHMPPCLSHWLQPSEDSETQMRKELELKVQMIWLWVCIFLFLLSISRPPFKGSTSQSSAQSASRKVTNSPSFWSEEWEEGPPRVEEISLLFFFFFLSLQLLSQEVHNTVEILNLGHSSQRTKKEEMDLELKSVQKRAEKRSLRNGSHIIVYELMVSCLRSMCMDLSL